MEWLRLDCSCNLLTVYTSMAELYADEHVVIERGESSERQLAPREASQKWADLAFSDLNLSSHDILERCTRIECSGICGKKRRYYCSECLVPLVTPPDSFPRVKLRLNVEILQSGAEAPQRSTAQHVALLAKGFVRVWRPFPECASEFRKEVLEGEEKGSAVVLYVHSGEGEYYRWRFWRWDTYR